MSSLDQFVVFKEVAETGNITQASKRLHISQPSVSVQIQNLEREYGAELFKRTNRGVTLTEPGNILYEKIIFVLHAMQQAKESIRDYSAHRNSCIHVGATMTIGEYLLPHIMSLTHPDGSSPRFNAHIANTHAITQEVLEEQLGIGLIEGPVPLDEDLVVEKFWSDELVLVVPMDHPWSKRVEVSFDELLAEKYITREKGSGTRKTCEIALAKNDFDSSLLNVVMELNSTQAIKEAVISGLGVAILSALTVQEEVRQKRLSMLRLQNCQITRPLNIITHRKAILTTEELWFLEQLRQPDMLRMLIPTPFLPSRPLAGEHPSAPLSVSANAHSGAMAKKDKGISSLSNESDEECTRLLETIIPHWDKLTKNEQIACRLVYKNESASSADVARTLNMSQRNGLNVLHGLLDKHLIEDYGGSKNRRYRPAEQILVS